MNEHSLLKITHGIDPDLIAEYASLTPKRRTGIRRGARIGIIVAAAVALAVPAGAYTYSRYSKNQSVLLFLPGAKDTDAFEVGHVMENEHLCRTIDILMSDGHNVMTIETQIYKDDIGKQFTRDVIQGDYMITYADGSELLIPDPKYGSDVPCIGKATYKAYISEYDGGGTVTRLASFYKCKGIDLNKSVRITYYANPVSNIRPEQYFRRKFPLYKWSAPEYEGETDNWLEGFEYVTSFAPNVKSVTLRSEDGTELIMSQFELFSETKDAEWVFQSETILSSDCYFILKNGEKRKFKHDHRSGGTDFITFGEIIDTDDYAGVEICGVQFINV